MVVDVVRDPAAHLVNLRRSGCSSRQPAAAVVALPPPVLCARLVPDLMADLRRARLTQLSQVVGGGEGTAPIIALPRAGEPLNETLSALRADGIERLVVYGGPEQPGFARELNARWPGAVEMLPAAQGSDLAPMLDDPAAVRWLSERVVRLTPGVRPPAHDRVGLTILNACNAEPTPWPSEKRGQPFAWTPERRAGRWTGLLPRAAERADAFGTILRAAWAERWGPETVRGAALGLDVPLQQALGPRAPQAVALPARRLVVTGIDGAGKSTHIDRLAQTLQARGARVAVVKTYRQGAFLELADELSGRVAQGASLANFRLSRVVKLVDSVRALQHVFGPAAERCDVLLCDRWTETHVAAARSQLGWDVTQHPALTAFPAADRAAWLLLSPEIALARLQSRGKRLTADEHPAGLTGYARVFEALANGPDDLRLDGEAPVETNGKAIEAFLVGEERWASAPGPPPEPVVQAPAARPRAQRCEIVVGWDPSLPALGVEALELRATGELQRAPLSFWLEAVAAQVVIDLRARRPTRACVPIWPRATARAWPDLDAILELARLAERECHITGWRRPRPADFAKLACPAGAVRLSAHYGAALAALATQQGWPELSMHGNLEFRGIH